VAPKTIRPTQGLIKGAIFNMLGPAVLESEVLDLYAGSGALGIEALSRGAVRATFVERSPDGVRAIRANLAALGYGDRAVVAQADALRWLRAHEPEAASAGLILLDPPYDDPSLDGVLAALDSLAAPRAIVVLEHSSRRPLPACERLIVDRTRRHGDTSVTIARASA
jgi:16S rRNA (guanine966-N2)-methyltransferase